MVNLRTRLDTIRHMGARQLACRVQRRWRQRFVYPKQAKNLFPWPGDLKSNSGKSNSGKSDGGENDGGLIPLDESRAAALRPRQALLAEADALVARHFTYLGLPTQDLGEPADWQCAPMQDPLWQYNLHYGQWAVDLLHAFLLTEQRKYRGTCIELVEDWLEGNPVGQRPAWDPYPICRRVVAWSRIAGALAEGSSIGRRFFHRRVEPSLRQQATFLAANLEYDVPNNHLIANFKALAWLGLLFPHWPEATHWRELALSGLWDEMRRQVLPDGVHNERSISYHCIVLQDLLEIRWLAAQREVALPGDVDVTLGRMLAVLEGTRTPGGEWPVTADTVPGYPCDPGALLRAGAYVVPGVTSAVGPGDDAWYPAWLGDPGDSDIPQGAPSDQETPTHTVSRRPLIFPQAGWAVLEEPSGGYLFFDAGALGPPQVLGHAHADALSFELHHGAQPLIVDPGVCTYRSGELRDRFRSTAVHNTIDVDGEDLCRFWGPFRVAYAPQVKLKAAADGIAIEGQHDGYRRLNRPIVHQRRISWGGDGWLIHDQLQGKGCHRFRSTLQLAPEATVSLHQDEDGSLGGEARWPGGASLRLDILEAPAGLVVEIEPGEVSPSWNHIVPAPRWVISWTAEAPSDIVMRLAVMRLAVMRLTHH